MVLPLRALVAGVRLQLPPQLLEALVIPLRALLGVPPHARCVLVGRLDPQRRGEVGALLDRLGVEPLGHRQPAEGSEWPIEVRGRQAADLLVLGEDRRSRRLALVGAGRRDDEGHAGAPATQAHDVTDAQGLERDGDLGPAVGIALARALLLQVGDPAAQRRVLAEVADVAVHGVGVGLQGLLLVTHLGRDAHDGPVGLELREGGLQHLLGRLPAHLRDEVDGHVVRRLEAGAKGVGPGLRETGHRHRVHPARPHDQGVSLDVDPPAPGAAGELGVLRRGDLDVRLAVELHQLLQHHGAGGHVDAQGEGLGREDGSDASGGEELLDDLAEEREHPGVVGGEAARDALDELVVAQDVEVLALERRGALLDRATVALPLALGDQPDVVAEELADRCVAAGSAEDEGDRGQQPVAVQLADDLGARRGATEAAASPARARGTVSSTAPRVPAVAPAATVTSPATCVPAPAGVATSAPVRWAVTATGAHPVTDRVEQLRVDLGR